MAGLPALALLERWAEALRDPDSLNPSGGTAKMTNPAGMKTKSMLRDGFLVVVHFNDEYEDKGVAGYSAIVTLDPLLRVGDARRSNGLSSLSGVRLSKTSL